MQLIKQIYKTVSTDNTKYLSVFNFVFPSTCVICKELSNRKINLCVSCEKTLPFLRFSCYRCAEPLPPSSVKNLICGACLNEQTPFDEIKSLFLYEHPIDDWITQTKFHENLIYARIFGLLMTNYFAEDMKHHFDFIIPVPLHRSRIKKRGFNQAVEIARPISKQLNIPLLLHQCKRIKNTNAQSQLTFEQRSSNIKKAFVVDKKFSAKKVLVIDDVVTTGSTIKEFCKTLKENGVEFIAVWVCARTVLK